LFGLIRCFTRGHRWISSEPITFFGKSLAQRFFRESRRDPSEQGSVVKPRDRRERGPQRRVAEKDQAKRLFGVIWSSE
jgi:hypothetical protein